MYTYVVKVKVKAKGGLLEERGTQKISTTFDTT